MTAPVHREIDDDAPEDPFEPPPSAILHLPLNQQHFHTFLAVVDAGGRLSSAAQHVGISQPGITHQLNELERRLNVGLLDRARGRPARLTRAGRLFERYARSITQLHVEMYAELEQMSQRLGGHLRVGASHGPGEHWLPPLLLAFRDQFPDLHIELHLADARSVVEQVFENEIEVGFVGGKWSRSGLDFEPIYRDELVLIAPPDHRFAEGRLSLADLAGVDFVAQEPGTGLRLTFEQELGDRGLSLQHFHVLAELGNQESVTSAVIAGYGIGCVWRASVEAYLTTGRVVALSVRDFDPDSGFYLVRRSNRRLSRRSRALIEHIRRAGEAAESSRRRARGTVALDDDD